MKISGFRKTSLIDYPGNIAAVVFTGGCNFRCPYCHNPELVGKVAAEDSGPFLDLDYLWDFLEDRKKLLDGLVITGGEPLLQQSIVSFIKKVKAMSMKVKLDTNGTVFSILKQLVEEKLLDYVALDIKTSFDKYRELVRTCTDEELAAIKKSIDLLIGSDIDYEFRTTVVPGCHSAEDIRQIARQVEGAAKFVLQNFRSGVTLDPSFQEKKRFPDEKLDEFKEIAEKYLQQVKVRY